MDKFYITTTLPYVNAPPHIGFALELVQADVLARYERLRGKEVVFNTGTDEHGLKIYRGAMAEKKDPQRYADEYAPKFKKLQSELNISSTNFIRTTDPHHKSAAQEFWKRCDKAGDIYKAAYQIKYCVGCELEKTDSELQGGRCPIHPNLELEIIEEENYFFRFSKYQNKLLEFYNEHPDFVVPDFRFNEIKRFVEMGLNDFSISRLKEKMPWGVPVPGDERHVMYVWFDALVNYISTLGWPEDEARFREFWPGAQIAGKDNLRQQSAMWQAMLMSAGLPNSKKIFIHGFINIAGGKMSKSLGNVVDPFVLIREFGTGAVRYYLLREIPSDEDGDFSEERFRGRYSADLANGLGNFAARVTTLAEKLGAIDLKTGLEPEIEKKIATAHKAVERKIADFKLHEAIAAIWELIAFGDAYVNEKKPWETNDVKTIFNLVVILDNVAGLLKPFLPATAEAITACIQHVDGKLKVRKCEALFPRI